MRTPKHLPSFSGDGEDKLEYIYNEYYDLMFRTVYSIVRDEETTADVVHEVILKIIPNIDAIRVDGTFPVRNYVYLTAKHTADEYRRQKEKDGVVDLDDPSMETRAGSEKAIPPNVLTSREKYRDLVHCIRSLPDLYRDVCYLKYVGELKEREIAKALNLSEQTVGLRVVRGKQILRKKISEEWKNEQ